MIDAFESMNHTLVMSCNVQRLEKNAINIWFNNHFRYTLVTESTFKTTDKKKKCYSSRLENIYEKDNCKKLTKRRSIL